MVRSRFFGSLLSGLLVFSFVLVPAFAPANLVAAEPVTDASDDGHAHPTPPIAARVISPPLKKKNPQPLGGIGSGVPAQTIPIAESTEDLRQPAARWQNTENYLVLGTDRRAGEGGWRTDTIMILGLDRATGRAALLSVPRDLYVDIPGYGMGRINQVDFIGERNKEAYSSGPALVSRVLSTTLGIATNHWVRIQMDGFVRMVDAVGGVTVHLDCPFYEPIFNLTTQSWDYFTLPAGDSKLDGQSSYWFVRLRLRESDIGRGRRQRQFLWALRNQVRDTNLLLKFPELWGAFSDTFSTDLGLLEMIQLAQLGLNLEPGNVHAGGLTLADLQSVTTAQGAQVLRINNPMRIRAIVNGVWEAQAMADTGRQDAAACPALPAGVTIDAPNTDLPKPGEGDADKANETNKVEN